MAGTFRLPPLRRAARERQAARDQAAGPNAREGVHIYGPEGWADRIRRYHDEHPRGPGRVILPIAVLHPRTAQAPAAGSASNVSATG